MLGRPVAAWARRWGQPIAAIAIALLTFLALRRSGSLADTDAALQGMGFDPDRARLLTSFVAEALAVAATVLITRAALVASLAGMLLGALEVERPFRRETTVAVAGGGGPGSFNVLGWAATLLTLVLALAITAWATASLALILRRWLVAAARDLRALASPSRSRRRVVRPALVALMTALLAVGLPVFGDMVNYTPDVDMRAGGTVAANQAITADAPVPASGAQLPAWMLDRTGVVPGGGPPASGAHRPVLATDRPWQRWRPSGAGSTTVATFPAPWKGGRR